jgi:phosphoribosyl-ATP pyrophosphohydrolase
MSQIGTIMDELYAVIEDRRANPKEGSYTNYLFDKGVDKICKKIGEEAAEVIIAAKNNNAGEIIYEVSDLLKSAASFCLTRSHPCGRILFARPQEGSFFYGKKPGLKNRNTSGGGTENG